MGDDAILILLALGPAGAVGFYWFMHRHYRNTDKSHAFEHETEVEVITLSGAEADHKVDAIRGTKATHIRGNNVSQHRQRVKPW